MGYFSCVGGMTLTVFWKRHETYKVGRAKEAMNALSWWILSYRTSPPPTELPFEYLQTCLKYLNTSLRGWEGRNSGKGVRGCLNVLPESFCSVQSRIRLLPTKLVTRKKPAPRFGECDPPKQLLWKQAGRMSWLRSRAPWWILDWLRHEIIHKSMNWSSKLNVKGYKTMFQSKNKASAKCGL